VARPATRSRSERRRDVFASTTFIDVRDVDRKSAFPAFWLLLMILLSILGIVAQATFA
jgi:hypothetical protein